MNAAKSLRRGAGIVAGSAALAVSLLAPAQSFAATCQNANANPNQLSLRAARVTTLCLLNQQRHHFGLQPLHESHRLDKASQRHARDMASRKYFAHGDFLGRIRAANYLSGARSWMVGENIAWGSMWLATPQSIVKAWMNSPEHRANILRGGFRQIGLGIADGAPVAGQPNGATYDTDFGSR